MGDTNKKKKTTPQKIKSFGEYVGATYSGAKAGAIGGIPGAIAGGVMGAAGNYLYDLAGDPEVTAATRKREMDQMREARERDKAATDALLKDHAEREKKKAQADKEKKAREQQRVPPGQDRDALRGRPKIVIPD